MSSSSEEELDELLLDVELYASHEFSQKDDH